MSTWDETRIAELRKELSGYRVPPAHMGTADLICTSSLALIAIPSLLDELESVRRERDEANEWVARLEQEIEDLKDQRAMP